MLDVAKIKHPTGAEEAQPHLAGGLRRGYGGIAIGLVVVHMTSDHTWAAR